MGQNSSWHSEQLNQYIFDFNSTTINVNNIIKNVDNRNNTFNTNDLYNSQNLSNNESSLSLSSTTGITNETIQLLAHRQFNNFSDGFAEKLSDAIQLALASNSPLTNANATTNQSGIDDDESSLISNFWIFLLITLYCIVVLGGVFGNASLIITLYTQSSARLRNPLLVALCLADLMVTGVAAPLTIVTLILVTRKTTITELLCKSILFMQVIGLIGCSFIF